MSQEILEIEKGQQVEEKEPIQVQPENDQPEMAGETQVGNFSDEKENEQDKPSIDIMNNLNNRITGHNIQKHTTFDEIKVWYKNLTEKVGGENEMKGRLLRTGINTSLFVVSLFLLKPITEFFAKMK